MARRGHWLIVLPVLAVIGGGGWYYARQQAVGTPQRPPAQRSGHLGRGPDRPYAISIYAAERGSE